ncbi:MAG: cytochrome c oxidase subunit II [Alphaproteobacteria bacterium]|nr:cytochrome c oxidase subunit II [Alphaproteobacteria bacterium]MBU0796195.1 cytochrome c oxidase subunit II [Alphaproteobacteria bacterium]MBU0888457.1 cytochrome c oxidase subunit II [Alphaproteobacteria bacterium]MBU1813080.1 cytochrome c oxidase subunit II [Alphaproteobacteria bacterium]
MPSNTMRIATVFFAAIGAALALTGLAGVAFASEPQPWQLGMQAPASVGKDSLHSLHDLLLWIITLTTIFVLALLIYVCVKFRADRNPNPSKTSHNTLIEVLWTVIPVVILVVIAVPSFRLLYFLDRTPNADMTIKVTGHQWYWNYGYPDHGDFAFDSYMIPEEELKPGQKRLLDVDNPLVVPVGKNIRVLVAGADVLHSWLVPALGVQLYTVPGKINETWFNIDRPGVYYGQCNQICGVNHAYMPVAIRAVPEAEFDAWVAKAREEFASNDGGSAVKVAQAAR